MNLTLATVDELVVELLSRCDDGVILLRKKLPSGEHIYKSRHQGPVEATVLMLAQEQELILRKFNESDEQPEPWEEF